MKIETRVNFGDKVTDNVNGFKGTATCVQISMNGCIQFFVESNVTKVKQETVDWWIDEQRLKVTKKSTFVPEKSKAEVGGLSRRVSK